MRVLIVEADPFLSKLYRVKLMDLKFEVDVALNGDEALRMIKTNKYDGIMMDLVLPYRDGFTLLNDMKKKRIKVKVVVSELQQKEDLEKVSKLGADHYFVKNDSQTYEIIEDFKALLQEKRLPHRTGYSLKKGEVTKLKPTTKRKPAAKKATPKKKTTPKRKAPTKKPKKAKK